MKFCKDCKHNINYWDCSNIRVITRDRKAYSILMVTGFDHPSVKVPCMKARRRGFMCGESAQYWEAKND